MVAVPATDSPRGAGPGATSSQQPGEPPRAVEAGSESLGSPPRSSRPPSEQPPEQPPSGGASPRTASVMRALLLSDIASGGAAAAVVEGLPVGSDVLAPGGAPGPEGQVECLVQGMRGLETEKEESDVWSPHSSLPPESDGSTQGESENQTSGPCEDTPPPPCCAITSAPAGDLIRLDDGAQVSAAAAVEWIADQERRGQPPVSPVQRGRKLSPQELQRIREAACKGAAAAAKRKGFQRGGLDGLGRLFDQMWGARNKVKNAINMEPGATPKIIAIGIENSGKSTLLNAVAALYLLPQGPGTVTKCPTEIRMCNQEHGAAPRIWVERTGGEVVVQPYLVPAATAYEDVLMEMDKLVQDGRGICTDHSVVVEVRGPQLPNLDIVDIPGISRSLTDPKRAEVSEGLAADILQRYKRSAIPLVVIPATSAPDEGLQVLERVGMVSQGIVVFTKSDYCGSDLKRLQNLLGRVIENVDSGKYDGGRYLPKGCYVTANLGTGEEDELNPTDIVDHHNLRHKHEADFFRTLQTDPRLRQWHSRLAECGRVGLPCLVKALSEEFATLSVRWISEQLELLDEEDHKTHIAEARLGLPAADPDTPGRGEITAQMVAEVAEQLGSIVSEVDRAFSPVRSTLEAAVRDMHPAVRLTNPEAHAHISTVEERLQLHAAGAVFSLPKRCILEIAQQALQKPAPASPRTPEEAAALLVHPPFVLPRFKIADIATPALEERIAEETDRGAQKLRGCAKQQAAALRKDESHSVGGNFTLSSDWDRQELLGKLMYTLGGVQRDLVSGIVSAGQEAAGEIREPTESDACSKERKELRERRKCIAEAHVALLRLDALVPEKVRDSVRQRRRLESQPGTEEGGAADPPAGAPVGHPAPSSPTSTASEPTSPAPLTRPSSPMESPAASQVPPEAAPPAPAASPAPAPPSPSAVPSPAPPSPAASGSGAAPTSPVAEHAPAPGWEKVSVVIDRRDAGDRQTIGWRFAGKSFEIAGVNHGTPAASAGVQEHWVLHSIAGRLVEGQGCYQNALKQAGDQFEAAFLRAKQRTSDRVDGAGEGG
eukprot:TRINITY_DN12177_c0_g2_i2.p1 TRINITY_DN12177_c0_g2~~TRINITY_DN12177_c0_g2_i2.p1  ORF type:complete len:1092 (+),score=184.66 TRINITY_DN12177_c0_g2_i2:110-3277(+)